MKELKPTERPRVYDLLREAGIDVSDWKNYRRWKHPASNPKYCYNWAFEGPDIVVLCLWYGHMQQSGRVIFQVHNHRAAIATEKSWTPTQRKRAQQMDHAFQVAFEKGLPVRVIVVDGPLGQDVKAYVEYRLLDPLTWFVASYEENGTCLIQRGEPDQGEGERIRRLARIAYNSSGWQKPTGEAADQEADNTYSAQNGFGHEDWLFRSEWTINGWRYAFIQGLNRSRKAYLGRPLDLSLYTMLPDKRSRLVATIYDLECLSDEQAKEALESFQSKGWLKIMQEEVDAIGGDTGALGNPRWAQHVLNVRFRLENVDMHPPEMFLPNNQWLKDRHRYMLYKFEGLDRERVERCFFGRRGTNNAAKSRRLFRRGTKPVEYTPEHDDMQRQLMAELKQQYGTKNVWREQDFVDVRVETEQELIYFEIKTDLNPRAVIRQALGQILEYAYHPVRPGRRPNSLVIVGRSEIGPDDKIYLQSLREKFALPLSYRVVKI